MKILKIGLQVLGIVLLIPSVALATLRFEHRNADGPSILFPGGELRSGDLYTGPEPDWGFTGQISTIELQLNDPVNSRLIWILESEGKIYIASGYMSTFLGRLWKHWAVQADSGDGTAVVRIDGTRYERQLLRVKEGAVLDGVAATMTEKYRSPTNRQSIEEGKTWIFELAPVSGSVSP
ncbi:MAG: hypothetical protein COA96_07095 [SAR86 cluster bacterium]|uniref:DUF2255 domain-containing protein n=1 Tax=SAR86 cluster bacterium TaxID=2030880 RepID=A0A2A5B261_9GAMM|nr:MAG: hypothetical protein COA96_07095 [SAR86 cluster bacterium]